jgi:hypothetical protein
MDRKTDGTTRNKFWDNAFVNWFIDWAKLNYWRPLSIVLAGAFGGTLLVHLIDDAKALINSAVGTDTYGGQYLLKSWTFHDAEPEKRVPATVRVNVTHGGGRVFGTVIGLEATWKFNGYARGKYVSFAYGGSGRLGTGTYAMQSDEDRAFWGFAYKVHCIRKESFYIRCPVLMYKKEDSTFVEGAYTDFLNRQCEKIKIDKASVALIVPKRESEQCPA